MIKKQKHSVSVCFTPSPPLSLSHSISFNTPLYVPATRIKHTYIVQMLWMRRIRFHSWLLLSDVVIVYGFFFDFVHFLCAFVLVPFGYMCCRIDTGPLCWLLTCRYMCRLNAISTSNRSTTYTFKSASSHSSIDIPIHNLWCLCVLSNLKICCLLPMQDHFKQAKSWIYFWKKLWWFCRQRIEFRRLITMNSIVHRRNESIINLAIRHLNTFFWFRCKKWVRVRYLMCVQILTDSERMS